VATRTVRTGRRSSALCRRCRTSSCGSPETTFLTRRPAAARVPSPAPAARMRRGRARYASSPTGPVGSALTTPDRLTCQLDPRCSGLGVARYGARGRRVHPCIASAKRAGSASYNNPADHQVAIRCDVSHGPEDPAAPSRPMTTWPSSSGGSSSPPDFTAHALSRPPRKKPEPFSQPGQQPEHDQQKLRNTRVPGRYRHRPPARHSGSRRRPADRRPSSPRAGHPHVEHLAREPGPMRDRSVRLALVRLVGLRDAEAVLDSMRVVLVRS
jgi:hypothetical protein